MEEILLRLFTQTLREQADTITKLPGAGSNRHYYRLKSRNHVAIGVIGEDEEEDKTFVYLSRHFEKQGLPTPRILATTDDCKAYLQEDLGDMSLFDFVKGGISQHDFNAEQWGAMERSIGMLPKIQFEGAKGLDFGRCFPQAEFDRRTVMWDLNYFKYCFLKSTKAAFLEPKLEDDFEQLANDLLEDNEPGTPTFLYRDFQSRNVMIQNGEPRFIDYQGGRRGPIYYDVASFVFQARLQLTNEQREKLIATYLNALRPYRKVDENEFKEKLVLFVFFRMLQTLGAYGYRGYFERKEIFLNAIPSAKDNLKTFMEEHSDYLDNRYPYLFHILQVITCDKDKKEEKFDGLSVDVYSFSYKKGIPADTSGNGGGYVFDCRGMHNPGRYEQYKSITGLDQPVIDYLLQQGEVQRFLTQVYALADPHVQRYIDRGFTHLSFAFGCTGGQHRSVFCAQSLAEHLHKQFPNIRVRLCHRERGITTTF